VVSTVNLGSQPLREIPNETQLDNTPITHNWDQINALRKFGSRKERSELNTVATNIERACVTGQCYNNAGVFLMDTYTAFPREGCSLLQKAM
jgi:hypothetical protein